MKCEIVLQLLIVFICADFLAAPGCSTPVPANKGGFLPLQGGNTWCLGSNSKCKFDMERRTRRLAVGDAPVPEPRLGSFQKQSKKNYPVPAIMTVERKSSRKDATTQSTVKIEVTKSADANKQNLEVQKSQKKSKQKAETVPKDGAFESSEVPKSQKKSKQETVTIPKEDAFENSKVSKSQKQSKQEAAIIPKDDAKLNDDAESKDDVKLNDDAKSKDDAKLNDEAKSEDDAKFKNDTKEKGDVKLNDDLKLNDDPKLKDEIPISVNSRSQFSNHPENNIEVIPKVPKRVGHDQTQVEKTAIKRNPIDHPKQSEEPNENQEPVVKPNIGKQGLKGLKKIIDDTLGEAKPSKSLIPGFKKPQINSCATLATRRQLQEASERISNLLGRLEQPHFNCGLLNTEIEAIKGVLQHVLIHTPLEGKRKEVDRTKIRDQIKERQAKIHARFGHLEIGKHGRLGGRGGIGREASVEDKSEVADLRGGKKII